MVGVSGLIRFALEYWAAVHFGYDILVDMKSGLDAHEAGLMTARLTFSARTPVNLPWGGRTTNQAYNVLTLLDKLNKVQGCVRNLVCGAGLTIMLQRTCLQR